MAIYMGWPFITPCDRRSRPVDFHYLAQGEKVARWVFEGGRDKMTYVGGGGVEWSGVDVMLIQDGRPISRVEWNAVAIPNGDGNSG